MKKSVLLLISLFAFITNACALETCTPTDEYLNYIQLSEEEKQQYMEPLYCKEMVEEPTGAKKIIYKVKGEVNSLIGATLPSYYSAVDDNLVNVVKNQYEDGTCWAFSALSTVETGAKKNNLPLYNLSEAHLIYSIVSGAYNDEAGKVGKYNTSIDGGRITYAATYLFGDYGMVEESELPYTSPHLSKINSSDYIRGNKLFSIDTYQVDGFNKPGVCSSDDIINIKNKILENGSVQGTVYWNDDYLYGRYYYRAPVGIGDNHGVTIVGWDDSISRNKFNATRDGAWIVKNSWGSTWGNHGYLYISYDDFYICEQYASYIGVSNETFNHTYQSSDVVGNTIIGINKHAYVATKIIKKSNLDETIKKISFSTPDLGSYNIYLASMDNLSNKNNWKKIGTGSSSNIGIDSIRVNEVIESDIFVIIEYISSTPLYILTTSSQTDDTDILTYETGMSFISSNTNDWYDLAIADHSEGEFEIEPIIYVYTNDIINYSSMTCPNIETSGESFELIIDNPNNLSINNIQIFEGNKDVTNDFEIKIQDSILINNINKKVGNYKVVIIDENDEVVIKTFDIKSTLVLPETYILSFNNILKIPVNTAVDYLINNITVYNSNYQIKDTKDGVISGGNIGTGFKLITGDNTYYFVIKGDSNGDAFIDSGDLLRMVKYLKGTINLDTYQFQAIELNGDASIDSGDLLKMVKYLKGTIQLD